MKNHRKMSYHKPYYDEDHRLVKYTFGSFLQDTFQFFARFFTFRNIKHAFRSVITGFREYAVFYVALIIIQCLFFGQWMNYDTYAKVEYENSRECEYNLLLEGYTNSEWVNIYNNIFYIADNQLPETRGYYSYEVSNYYGSPGVVNARVKFLLIDDSEQFCLNFLNGYKLGGEHVTCTFGERTLYGSRVAEKYDDTVSSTLWLGVLAALIVVILFMIRANNFRFRYGIYMTFGADFEKLVETAAWELLAVAIITFLPSLLISGGIYSVFVGDFEFSSSFKRIIPEILWTLSIIFAGVIPAVKLLSVSTPVDMICAQDNSNYVSSPRRSFHIFGKSFPWHYEIYGFIRFRKYYILLIVFTVIFTTLFSCGVYLSDIKKTEIGAEQPQFEIASTYEEFDDELLDEICEVEGVKSILFGSSRSCTAVSSYVVLSKSQAKHISSKTVECAGGYADNNFKYVSMSPRLIEEITSKKIWTIDGDLTKLSGEDAVKYVAVTCNMNNREALNFMVGETITLAKLIDMDKTVTFDKYDRKFVLQKLLEGGYYDYFEVTICAVIDNGLADSEYSIYVSDDLYREVAKEEPKTDSVQIYLKDDVDAARTEKMRDEICKIIWNVSGSRIESSEYFYENRVEKSLKEDKLIIMCAAAVLFAAPLVWFYSQIMFGRKREKEMYIISALGGTDTSLMKLFCVSGLVLAGLAAVATALLTSILTYLIYYFFNIFLPSLGFGENIRYTYSFSVSSFFICVGLSILSAVVSSVIPFLIYRRDRDKRMKVTNEGKNA